MIEASGGSGKGDQARVLVLCYGNPGRLDDGLGPALGAELEQADLPENVTVDIDYQLTVEDAAEAAAHDVVIFADAAVAGPEPFAFGPLAPGDPESFSTHAVTAEAVLALAGKLFGKIPDGYALAIRGYEFNEFGERLSERASENLERAREFLLQMLGDWPPGMKPPPWPEENGGGS